MGYLTKFGSINLSAGRNYGKRKEKYRFLISKVDRLFWSEQTICGHDDNEQSNSILNECFYYYLNHNTNTK